MSYSAILNYKRQLKPETIEECDNIYKCVSEALKNLIKDKYDEYLVHVNENRCKAYLKDADEGIEEARKKLSTMAKKIGLKPRGSEDKPDIQYSKFGDNIYYQIWAE